MRIDFVNPGLLVSLGLLPLWWLYAHPPSNWGVLLARIGTARRLPRRRVRVWALTLVPQLLRASALASAIVALAGPRAIKGVEESQREEVAIVVAVDLSSSMTAVDMGGGRSRIQAARETAAGFVRGRSSDRIGLVAFAGEAVTRVPMTHDPYLVLSAISALQIGMLFDGTDITSAILAAADRLRETPHRSRVLILVTDGAHNAGGLDPLVAARVAAAYGIRIYSVSIGTTPLGATREAVAMAASGETVLTGVARLTGGRYFRARDRQTLESIYSEINRLETTSLQIRRYAIFEPLHLWFFVGALLLVLAEWQFRGSRWGTVP